MSGLKTMQQNSTFANLKKQEYDGTELWIGWDCRFRQNHGV